MTQAWRKRIEIDFHSCSRAQRLMEYSSQTQSQSHILEIPAENRDEHESTGMETDIQDELFAIVPAVSPSATVDHLQSDRQLKIVLKRKTNAKKQHAAAANKPFLCEICLKSYAQRSGIVRHIREKHRSQSARKDEKNQTNEDASSVNRIEKRCPTILL